ncbi:unnamed protein product [Rhizoctonia solani]|uniref:Large ribosomal subunit protein uL11m n=1 Tax=Rhizoctonia solani TaxID=456999 RepID=A0A8H3BHG3_9AGAM|nr:unnamed protein product [Rhizoctonia solani]
MSKPAAAAQIVRLLVPAGKAAPTPPVGPALGARGVKSMDFCKEFNARTAHMEPGIPTPTLITVQPDRTFTFVTKTPPVSYFLKKAAGIEKGTARPGHDWVGTLTLKHVYEIAKIKATDEHMKHIGLEGITKHHRDITMAPKSKASAAGVKHKFFIDYSRPAGDGVFDAAAFEDYLRGRIKLDGKTGQLGDKIKITRDSKKLTVASTVPLSKRYVKYLTQKFLKKNSLRDWIRVVATSKDGYELRFYKIDSIALSSASPLRTVTDNQVAFELRAPESSIQIPSGFNIDLESKRLVQFNDEEEPVMISELEKIIAKAAGRKFFDITDHPESALAPVRVFKHSYESPKEMGLVKPVLKTLSTEGPKANLEKFTSFRTRYYRSETGKQSQQWLKAKIAETTGKFASSSLKSLISISEFPHSWGQNSIILRIKGSDPNAGTVIISAHQDSTNMWPFLPAPGADDDGSGTVTILEAYRGLIAANFTPVHDVEFHWYSAEEGGLLGSQAVAKHYSEHGANIKAQIQFDMTAWVQRGSREEVGIITDFVDPDLTAYVTKLVETYLSIPPAHTKCGYACSDHASWTKYGYPSAFSIESSFETTNHNIHSANDRIDYSPEFSFEHALEFSKLAVAFAIELGGWQK